MSESQPDIEVLRRYLQAVSGSDIDLDVLDEILAKDVIHNGMPEGRRSGRSGMKAQQESFGSTWADRNIEIEDVVAAGGRVAARLTLTARHVGEFGGIEATSKQVRVDLMAFARVEDGRIAEWWEVADVFGLLQQLNVSPLHSHND